MIHDSLTAVWSIAQPFVDVSSEEALQQSLCIAAQECCSTTDSLSVPLLQSRI